MGRALAAGVDNMELLKYADSAVPLLTNICSMVWHQQQSCQQIQTAWKKRNIRPTSKVK